MSADEPHHRAFWRDNVEAVVMAVVMALFLKYFVVEAYKIPTGSMQPTLIGDEKADIKDRILVDKLTYALRAPERWEVAVFRYPLDRSKNFVKRIVGVGPEEFRIRYGDLWHRTDGSEWQILRRPRSVMESVWKKLDARAPEQSRWIPKNLPASSHWKAEGRAIQARGPGGAAFRGGHTSILDGYLDGYPEELLEFLPANYKESDQHEVGDLRVDGTLRALSGLVRASVILREGERSYRFDLPGPAASAGSARIDAGPHGHPASDAPAATLPYRLPAGRSVHFAAQNLDDRLELELDGQTVLALEIDPAEDQTSSVTLELEGEGADLSELMVHRDIYYTTEDAQPVTIPAGCYYMLGDNTQDSSDSREWRFTIYDVASPDGTHERVRGNWRQGENPRSVAYGEPGGPLTYLVDEFGEKHWFPREEAQPQTPESEPFVPLEMIEGKALAVFWPLDPIRGIWRLKWVN